MIDKIFIHDLKIQTLIGAFSWEKSAKQTIIIDLEFSIDTKKIAENDNLAHAIDYTTVATRLTGYIQENNYLLIETLAEHVATFLLNEFQLPWLRLQIRKQGTIPNAREVGVVIERAAL